MDLEHLWSDMDLSKSKQNTRCLAVNTILAGKYLVGPVLGQGGFGITYMGYDLNMETRIAIKEYFPVELVSRDTTTMHGDRVLSLSGEKSVTYQQGLKKYVAEAQNVSQFSEVPGVVSVKDFFYENETAYIVMEYIDGISLKDYLKEKGGILSEEETLLIMKPVLEALEKVHSAGIIHRDISPDNIMLTFEESGTGAGAGNSQARGAGVSAGSFPASGASTGAGSSHVGRAIRSVKLIDFGAARMTSKNDQKSLTIILKHGYAPEEQYRTHGEQGTWTDVYAVCAVLYRMLTGQTPVPAMDRLFKDELKSFAELGFTLRAGSGVGQISENTSAAILKGLAVKKEDRIQSMGELIAALYEGAKVGSGQKKKNTGMILGISGAVIAFVLLIAVGAVALSGYRSARLQQAGQGMDRSSDPAETQTDGALSGENPEGAETEETDPDAAAEELQMVDLEEQEEELGEQIAFYHPQRSISSSGSHVLFCMEDGTVQARGTNEYGECNVEEWTHVVAVAAGTNASYGLRSDGTVLYAGADEYAAAALWTDMVDIQPLWFGAVGLKKDGTVEIAGFTYEALDRIHLMDEVATWSDIKAITVYESTVYGLRTDGTVVAVGYLEDQSEVNDISGWEDVVYMSAYRYVLCGLLEDGTIKTAPVRGTHWGTYRDSAAEQSGVVQFDKSICVKEDGSVSLLRSSQSSSEDYKELIQNVEEEWTDIQAAVLFSETAEYYYALKKDGTILCSAPNMGNAELADMTNLEWIRLFEDGGCENLIAYTRDGKVLAYGSSSEMLSWILSMSTDETLEERIYISMDLSLGGLEDDSMELKMMELEMDGYDLSMDVEYIETGWTVPDFYNQICSEAAKVEYFDTDVLLRKDGTAYFHNAGNKGTYRNVKQVFSKSGGVVLYEDGSLDSIYDSSSYSSLKAVVGWTDVEQLVYYNNRFFALKEDGTVLDSDGEKPLAEGIVALYAGDKALFGVTEAGTVEVLRSMGNAEASGMLLVNSWKNVQALSVGKSHTVGLLEDGTVVATGSNKAGQCDVEEWKDVVTIVAGNACTLGITGDGSLLIAGELQ